jgi:hypothetical protein
MIPSKNKEKPLKSVETTEERNAKEDNREELKQALRNHAESSIYIMKVHTRSSFRLIILPSHKISP